MFYFLFPILIIYVEVQTNTRHSTTYKDFFFYYVIGFQFKNWKHENISVFLTSYRGKAAVCWGRLVWSLNCYQIYIFLLLKTLTQKNKYSD